MGYGASDVVLNKDWYLSLLAGYGWQLGRLESARKAADAITGEPDVNGFQTATALPKRSFSGIFALTGPHAKELLAAERSGIPSQIAETYKTLAEKIDPKDPAAWWIRTRALEGDILTRFNQDQAILFTPDDELLGFEPYAGAWKWEQTDQGPALVGTADNDGLGLVLTTQFGNHYELHMTIEIIDDAGVTDAAAGLVYGFSSTRLHLIDWIAPKSKLFGRRYSDAPLLTKRYPHINDGVNTIDLQVNNDKIGLAINSTWVGADVPRDYFRAPDLRVGLASPVKKPGFKVRYRDLMIRKI